MKNILKSLKINDLLIFIGLVVLYNLLPDQAIGEWAQISLKKITLLILVISMFQFMGLVLINLVNSHAGVILHGFIGGIISSTALTVFVAKNSKKSSDEQTSIESLSLLSGILAMLLQAALLILFTAPKINFWIFSIVIIPIITTIVLLLQRFNHTKSRTSFPEFSINWHSSFKLALFIVFILTLSFNGQKLLGNETLYLLTFIVSLFELHGSVIASAQLYSSGSIDLLVLNNLLTLAFISSYMSKIFIIYALGSKYLQNKILEWAGWSIFSILIAFLLNYLL